MWDFHDREFTITERYQLWFAVSAVVILIGLGALFFNGLNLGIDFAGGTELHLEFEQAVAVSDITPVLEEHGLKDSTVLLVDAERADAAREIIVRSTSFPSGNAREALLSDIRQTVGPYKLLGLSGVSPVISRELTRNALIALVISIAVMIIYITIRFEFNFALAAMAALIHDGLVTLGLFALSGSLVDSAFVAAILTVLGYSINDTIVIFDRIRENIAGRRHSLDAEATGNRSIAENLARSINTSLTTLLVLGALYVLGGESIRPFILALVIGIISGTYSSNFIAVPLWVRLTRKGAS